MATRPFEQLALRFLAYTGRMRIRGVSWNGQRNKWAAKITIESKRRHLGLFDDPAEAARVIEQARAGRFPVKASPPRRGARQSGRRSWRQWSTLPY